MLISLEIEGRLMDGWVSWLKWSLYVGFGLGKVGCLLCGCVWGIGRYLSRRRHEGVVRDTGGEFRMRFQRR